VTGRIAQMPRKKLKGDLPEEVLVVLRISPDLKPCPKFRRANIYQFGEHLNEVEVRSILGPFPPVGEGTADEEIPEREQKLSEAWRVPGCPANT